MPLGRSFVFLSLLWLPPDAYLLHIHFRYSGPVPYLHHMHFRYSGPMPYLHHMHFRYSGPAPNFHSGPVRMLPGPVRMPPCFRDHPDIPTPRLSLLELVVTFAVIHCRKGKSVPCFQLP